MFYYILVFLVLAIDLEAFTGSNVLVESIAGMALIMGTSRFAFIERGNLYIGSHWNKTNIVVLFVFFTLFMLSVLRLNGGDITFVGIAHVVVKVVCFGLFMYLFFSYEYRNSTDFEKTFTKLLSFLILAPSITILIFLLFYVVGYNKAVPFGEGENLFLSLLGIHLEKRNIPFINAHPNTIGIYAGATLVMSVIGIWTLQLEKKYHTLLLVNVAICSIFLLVVDSRGTILNTLIAILAVYVLNRIHAVSMLRYVVIISPFLPFIMLFVLSTFADNPLIAQLSRNEGDLETGNSRGIIWQYCLNELMDVKPIHFIGYGANGQVPSGVSKLYAYFFSEEGGDQMITHNYFIQSLFDLGYIGSFMLLAVMYIAITNAIDMYKGRIKSALVLIGFMTYYTLSGTTESTFGVYNRIYNSIFIMVLIFILLSKNEFDYYAAKEE